ncbi:MAG: type IV pilus modification PilV family protein [Deltaproteobacteria bacterium]
MIRVKDENGFTFIEILIALAIMAFGFLAMAQMEFLSLKQKQLAEAGTIATNMIQFISDRDMAEVKRRYLLNSAVYSDAQAGRTPNMLYCDGSSDAVCGACPCDPLEAVTANPDDGVSENSCAALNSRNPDPSLLQFRATKALCQADAAALPAGSPALYVTKLATTDSETVNGVEVLTVSIGYAIKTPAQFAETPFSGDIRDSLASQTYEITAQIDNYTDIIAGWSQVRVPHVP